MERRRLKVKNGSRHQSPRGSASILTDKLIEAFCQLIMRGLPVDGACDYLGVSSTAFWAWKDKGEKYLLGDNQPKEYALYGKFAKALRKAMSEYRLERVDKLHNAKKMDWIREMAILERRDRKNFGKNEPPGGSDEHFDPDQKFL